MGRGSLKKDHATIGLRKVFERCQMVEFHDFQPFALILHFPFLLLKKVLRNSGNSSFSHPRSQAAQKLVKPMEFHPFLGVLGALGHNFRKIQFFAEITRNVENMISLLISDFT